VKDHLEDLWRVVRSIPAGSISTYGDVGRALRFPTTGRMVGRWLGQCPRDVPWWRVIATTGQMPIGKRDPYLQMEQQELLRREGVLVEDGVVDVSTYRYIP
jgi:methylated-DNA-protein-cysteine methyltransferase-like protein